MLRQLLDQTDDVLTHRCILLICPVCTDLDRTIPVYLIYLTAFEQDGHLASALDEARWVDPRG